MEVLRSVLVEKKQWMLEGLGCYFKQFQITELKEMSKLERFSYDLEMKTHEQNRNNKRTEMEWFDWFIERIQTRVAFPWLSERSAEKNSCPKNFLQINRYFALTSYCNRIGQSNNTFSILAFHWLIKITNEHLPKPFFRFIRKTVYCFKLYKNTPK